MHPAAQILFTTGVILLAGCATKDTPAVNRVPPPKQSQVVPVVAQAKYYLSEVPPRLVWAEIYGDEAAIGISDNTNINGVVLEIIEPAEFAGKIYTLRGGQFPYLTNNHFALGEMYEFRASVRNIGKFVSGRIKLTHLRSNQTDPPLLLFM